jgi:hypothetical protein
MVSPNPVMQGMTNLERRRTPRTAITGHAYVNIEPNNGGIVLNVSDGGLCFHSFDPVQRNGRVRFWFADNNRRIEADATLAWTDETHKGGLRFTALPAEAREHIRQWMIQSATSAAVEGVAPAALPLHVFPTRSDNPVGSKSVPVGSAPLGMVSTEVREPARLSGFSRGLVTGLLISAVVGAAFLFHNYRREFGESLIQLGERFAAKPQAQSLAIAAASPATSTAAATVLPSPPAQQVVLPAAAPTPDSPSRKTPPQPDKLVIQSEKPQVQPQQEAPPRPLANPAPPQQAKLEPTQPVTSAPPTTAATPTAVNTLATGVSATVSVPAISLAPPTTPSPTATASSGSSPTANKPDPAPKVESAKPPEVQTESSTAENGTSTSELYFDVGKFKNQSQAHVEMNKLSQLGFPTTAVQKGFLWTNSYHILVGPYSDEERAKATHENLVSSGFKPRPFERGSRPFTLNSPVTLNGTRTPPGDYIISWESSLDDATVKLLHNDYLVASANARWVKRDVKYPRDAYVYRRNADGSRTLIEIRFGGTRQALVFGKSS